MNAPAKSPSLYVVRLSTSAYFETDFLTREKKAIEEIDSTISYFKSLPDFLMANKSEGSVIAITNTHTKMDELKQLENSLALVVHPNSGYDNFTFDTVKTAKHPIILGNPIREKAVSEYILSSLFDALAPLKRDTQWSKDRRYSRNLISDAKVLIVGHGLIGKRIEKVLLSLSSSVQTYDPFKIEGHSNFESAVVSFDPDVLIFSAGLNPTSKKMLNQDIFKHLKNDIVIINGARGELIDEKAMIAFAKKNSGAKFYLDVFEEEPCDFSQFSTSQFIKSSHTAGVFNQLTKVMIDFECEVISDFIKLSSEEFYRRYSSLSLKERLTDNYLI